MRNAWAIALIAVFSLPLFAPLFAARAPEEKLPPCCRRDGKHGCGMAKRPVRAATAPGQPALTALCPLYPAGKSAPASAKLATPPPAIDSATALLGFLTAAEQTEARFRVSFSRARQKRGPPSPRV